MGEGCVCEAHGTSPPSVETVGSFHGIRVLRSLYFVIISTMIIQKTKKENHIVSVLFG